MESEYFWEMVWKISWTVVCVVVVFRAGWRKVKEKRKLNELAMYATVEAEKLKWEREESADPSARSGQAADS